MKEIGSEFWLTEDSKGISNYELPLWLNFGSDNKLLLSGRTALDFVLRDILKNRAVKTVYFPSYCCQSMLQPFVDHGIDFIFYNVDFDGALSVNINTLQECDIFFAMNYFGFTKGRMDNYIKQFKKQNVIVIEDVTHSLLSDKAYNPNSNYIIASLRKWFPIISGGLAAKSGGQFYTTLRNITLDEMISVRKKAMIEKRRFLNGDNSIRKEEYLSKYNQANESLNTDYSLYSIDNQSFEILQNLDVKSIARRRKDNAKILYDKIEINGNYQFLFRELEHEDCPIFVPIIFNNYLERNRVRSYLINNNVFCPIHWPKPSLVSENNDNSIYNKELSLIADQRYNEADMQYIIRRLGEIYE